MNKLETLNSPKYSLTPEKMGELVGGEIRTECSNNENGFNLGYYKGRKISADYIIYYTGADVQNDVEKDTFIYCGANDEAIRNEEHGSCR